MHKLSLNAQIKQNESIFSSQVDDEAVMLNVDLGKYFGMNPIGSTIWEKIKTPMTVNDLIQALTTEYDISFEQCQTDIMPFLENLVDNQLVDIVNADAA